MTLITHTLVSLLKYETEKANWLITLATGDADLILESIKI